jgi:hypothetical protein
MALAKALHRKGWRPRKVEAPYDVLCRTFPGLQPAWASLERGERLKTAAALVGMNTSEFAVKAAIAQLVSGYSVVEHSKLASEFDDEVEPELEVVNA